MPRHGGHGGGGRHHGGKHHGGRHHHKHDERHWKDCFRDDEDDEEEDDDEEERGCKRHDRDDDDDDDLIWKYGEKICECDPDIDPECVSDFDPIV